MIHDLCLSMICIEFQEDSQVRILINVLCQKILAIIFAGMSNINKVLNMSKMCTDEMASLTINCKPGYNEREGILGGLYLLD